METKQKKSGTKIAVKFQIAGNFSKILTTGLFFLILSFMLALPASAHCDSYDGPVIKDAIKALESNNVNFVLKWISKEQELEIISLFNKTYNLRKGNKEGYEIAEKYLFETLVRLHRETEGAPYTGLKAAGTTKKIVQMSDKAIATQNPDDLLNNLNNHIEKVIHEKYEHVAQLSKVKDESPDMGREYVKAYVDYTHTLEAIHEILELSSEGKSAHKH